MSSIQEDNGPALEGASAPRATASLEIANGVARLHKEFVGRGPTNTRVTIDDDVVLVLLEGGFTRAEQTLDEADHRDIVAAARHGLQDAMRNALIATVETTLGRRVRSFMSANDLRHNLQAEVFLLHSQAAADEPGLG